MKKFDKKIFLGLPLGAIILLLASIIFGFFIELKLDFISKIILIVILVLVFLLLNIKINPSYGHLKDPEIPESHESPEYINFSDYLEENSVIEVETETETNFESHSNVYPEIYSDVEIKIDYNELRKAINEENRKISDLARKNLDLKISGEGIQTKKIALCVFPDLVKFADVEAFRLKIGAEHGTWEDLYYDYKDLCDGKSMIVFGTYGRGNAGQKMVASRNGLNPISTSFRDTWFVSGIIFPLVIQVKN